MSPSHARRRTSRGKPFTEDLYRADKELSKQHSLRQRFLRFLRHKISPEATSDRKTVARKDSLELAIRQYSAHQRFWTDVYDDYPPFTQSASAKSGGFSIHTDSPMTRRTQQSVHHNGRPFRDKNGLGGHRDKTSRSDEGGARQSMIADEESGAEERGETGRIHEDTKAGDGKSRPKKRVHFAV